MQRSCSSNHVKLLDLNRLPLPAISIPLGSDGSRITQISSALDRTFLERVHEPLPSRSAVGDRAVRRSEPREICQIGRIVPRQEHRIIPSSGRCPFGRPRVKPSLEQWLKSRYGTGNDADILLQAESGIRTLTWIIGLDDRPRMPHEISLHHVKGKNESLTRTI